MKTSRIQEAALLLDIATPRDGKEAWGRIGKALAILEGELMHHRISNKYAARRSRRNKKSND